MIAITSLGALLVLAVTLTVVVVVVWRAIRHHETWWLIAARVFFVLHLGWIVNAVFFPIPLHALRGDLSLDPSLPNHPNWVPGRTLAETWSLTGWPRWRLLGGNTILFVPFGFFVPLPWPRTNRFLTMFALGLLFLLTIEIGQLLISLAVGFWICMADIDDVILNVSGVLAGWLLFRLTTRLSAQRL